ncbi:hypothetical protein RND81_05G148000 [Saponaria officinalis]|uniref:Epidermal patterning factor-like protein n=1 Tax=Saponaria officinalis TaxID=3572 RepID=A0AAW1KWT7_SAPOF
MGRDRHRLWAAILAALIVGSMVHSPAGLKQKQPRWARESLVGPGSSPPTCRSKCGRCTPCKAVHVPIHPGVSMPLEYYPEAWRCKCGNKLYMP